MGEPRFKDFSKVMPKGFEEVRKQALKPPLSKWNLAPWMDFRQCMDDQFAFALERPDLHANSLTPKTPAGFVGGQGPGPWGGYDYSKLTRAVPVDGGLRHPWGKRNLEVPMGMRNAGHGLWTNRFH